MGFREDQLDEYEGQAIYDQEIQKIKEIIQNYSDKYEKKIPIAIGGGIHDSESAAHAFSLGADAIQVQPDSLQRKNVTQTSAIKKHI